MKMDGSFNFCEFYFVYPVYFIFNRIKYLKEELWSGSGVKNVADSRGILLARQDKFFCPFCSTFLSFCSNFWGFVYFVRFGPEIENKDKTWKIRPGEYFGCQNNSLYEFFFKFDKGFWEKSKNTSQSPICDFAS